MKRLLYGLLVALRLWAGQAGVLTEDDPKADGNTVKWARALAARLEWEILWGQSPNGFKVPEEGPVRVALLVDRSPRSVVSYCSGDLGVCTRYRLVDQKMDEPGESAACSRAQPDGDAVLQFAGAGLATHGQGDPGRFGELGSGGLVLLRLVIAVHSPNQIRDRYRKSKPAGELRGLVDWLSKTSKDFTRVQVPCFLASDPEVILYGERIDLPPIAFQVKWLSEDVRWIDGWYVDESEDKETVRNHKSVIDSMTCATVHPAR